MIPVDMSLDPCYPTDMSATATPTAPTVARFAVGQTVTCRSACNSDCVWTFVVVARTARFVTLRDVDSDETMRVGVREHDGEEWASPFGSFSMAPVVRASVA